MTYDVKWKLAAYIISSIWAIFNSSLITSQIYHK